MAIKLNSEMSSDAVVCDEHGAPVESFVSGVAQIELISDGLNAVMAHQSKCKTDAVECLKFYFNKNGTIDLALLESWLAKNQPLDRWFFVHLIEVAGQRFVDQTFSNHKAEIARSKNAVPRAFVLDEWSKRNDQGQSKAAFARQFAPLVKRQFDLVVTPETIARDWLPKGKS